tara:strand:+ start:1419 stop:1994 length:576 start_codon:yes stop_codon:yes gene_type:complete
MENNLNVVNTFLGTLEYAERPDSKSELLPESYQSIKDIVGKTNPKAILELGFNRGSSAAMFAHAAPNREIISIDHYSNNQIKRNANRIKALHKHFYFIRLNHNGIIPEYGKTWKNKFDLVYINGDKDSPSIKRDILAAMELNTKFIALDQYNHEDIKPIYDKYIKLFKLNKIKVYATSNGIALISNSSYAG